MSSVKRAVCSAQNSKVQPHLARPNNDLGSPSFGVMSKQSGPTATSAEGEGWVVVRRVRRAPRGPVGERSAPPVRKRKWVVKCDHNPRAVPVLAQALPVSPARSYLCVLMSNMVQGKGKKPRTMKPPPPSGDVASSSAGHKTLDNPAYVASYRGCADLEKTLNQSAPPCTPGIAREMQKLLDLHADQADRCCTVRSLLAFCATEDEFRFVAEQDWNGMSASECGTMAIKFCEIRDRPLDMRRVAADATLVPMVARKGNGKCPVNICIAHLVTPENEDDISGFIAHAMPLFRPSWHQVCKQRCNHTGCRVLWRAARVTAKFEAAAQKHAVATYTAMTVEPPPAPTTLPKVTVPLSEVEKVVSSLPPSEARQLEIILRKSFGLPDICEEFPSVVKDPVTEVTKVDVGVQCDEEFPGWRFDDEPQGCVSNVEWEFNTFEQRGYRHVAAGYQGKLGDMGFLYCKHAQYCTDDIASVSVDVVPRWMSCATRRVDTHSLCHNTVVDVSATAMQPFESRDAILNMIAGAPSVAIMSLNKVRKWGTACRYVAADQFGHCLIDGDSDLCLGPRAILELNGVRYHFREEWYELCCRQFRCYRLAELRGPSGLGALWRFARGCVMRVCGEFEVVSGGYADLDKRQEREAKWAMERLTERDAINASLIAKAQARAISDPADQTNPEVYSSGIRRLRHQYEAVCNVGGVYGWGYCYSCGTRLKGKFDGRVCLSCTRGTQSRLARMVAEGLDCCTASEPVRNPGLVFKPAEHPSLKEGVETRAEWGRDVSVSVNRGKRRKELSLDQALALSVVPGKGPTLAGVGLSGTVPFVTAGGVQPLVEAVLYRVFKKLPDDRVVSETAFDRLTSNALSDLLLGGWLSTPVQPMSVDEWIQSMPSVRRKALLKAKEAREMRGCEHPDFDTITPFVKKELLPSFKPVDSVGTAYTPSKYVARLIQAPNDETHLIAGPYMKPLVRTLKECWHADNWVFYGSVSPDKLNHWLARIAGCQSYFWSDYSSFDATFSSNTWKMLESFYHRIYPDAPLDFQRVLDIWRTPKGRAFVRKQNAVLRYQAQVCNCSGRDDTALANALFNGLALCTAFAAAFAGKTVEEVTVDDLQRASELCIISIVGDDSLVGCHVDIAPYAEQIVAGLKRFGLVVKAEHSRNLCDVTYLGMMPYQVGPRAFEWGPTIGRRMYKMLWMREYRAPGKWCRGIAQSMMQFRNVPLVSDLARRANELLDGQAITPPAADENRPWTLSPTDATPWSQCTLDWLCQRYRGLTCSMLRRDLRTIRSIKRLPAVVRLESLRIMCAQDDL